MTPTTAAATAALKLKVKGKVAQQLKLKPGTAPPNGQYFTGRTTVWTEDEDAQLRELVSKYGTKKWAFIADHIKSKASKQCRRRWQNYLNADVTTGGWSQQEDNLLIEGHRK